MIQCGSSKEGIKSSEWGDKNGLRKEVGWGLKERVLEKSKDKVK